MEILRCEGVSKVYGSGDNQVIALDQIDLSVEKGEFVAVMGASGSGKSTLLHILGSRADTGGNAENILYRSRCRCRSSTVSSTGPVGRRHSIYDKDKLYGPAGIYKICAGISHTGFHPGCFRIYSAGILSRRAKDTSHNVGGCIAG